MITTKSVLGGALLLGLACAGPAFALDGKWNANASDNWSTASRWTNSQIADGVGFLADIAFDINANRTITNSTARTIGKLRFQDPTNVTHDWTIGGTAVLTLQVAAGGSPTIEVVNRTATISTTLGGTQGFTKLGTGTLALGQNSNNLSGKIILNAGTTRVRTGSSFGAYPASYVADQITLNGGALMNNDSDGVIVANQGITLGASGGTLVAGWSRPLTIDSPIVGSGGLTIANDTTPGVVSLNGVNTYTGFTRVANGANNWAILLVNGSLAAGSTVGVTLKGWLGGDGTINGPVWATNQATVSAGARFKPGTLTMKSGLYLTNCFLSFDLGNATTVGAGVNDLIDVTGDLAIDGVVTVDTIPVNGPLANGSYRLINYTGALLGTGTFAVPSHYGMSIDTNTPGQINLVVSGSAATLVWNDSGNAFWDVAASSNWLNGANSDVFYQGDNVVFNDAGAYSTNFINMIGASNQVNTLAPASIVFDTTNNLTLSGANTTYGGRLAGQVAIYKGNTGTVTLSLGNTSLPSSFDGPVVVTNGVILPANNRVLGSLVGGVYATNGGTFDVNAQNLGFEPITIEGAGYNGQGALVNNNANQQQNALRQLTLAGDATVGGIGRFDLRGSVADTFLSTGGQPYKLTKVGPQQFALVSATIDPALGDVEVKEGIVSLELNSTGLGDPTKTLLVRSNATFLMWAATNQLNKQIVLQGGTVNNINSGSGTNNIIGPITLEADSLWTVAARLNTFNNISGAGGLTKAGGAALYLYGANTYSGPTTINANRLALGSAATLPNTPLINVGSGTTFDVSEIVGGFTLNSGQTLAGSGSVTGRVNAVTGTTVSPGPNATTPGTLTFQTGLSLNSATAVFNLSGNATNAGANDLVVVNSSTGLPLVGVNTIRIDPLGPLDTVNPYTLFVVTNALPSGSEANFAVTTDSRYNLTVLPTDSSLGTNVQVKVEGTGAAATLVWTGTNATNPTWWDLKTTTNWLNAETPDKFFQGDVTVFDDTAVGTTADLVGTVPPSLVLLSNATKAITIAGSGSFTPGSIRVDGSGITTFANTTPIALTYGITNTAGTIVVGNTGANTVPGGLALSGGTTVLANVGNNIIGPVNVNAAALTATNLGPNTFGNVLLGSGTFTLGNTGNNTFGSLSLVSGALALGNTGNNTFNSVTVGSGTATFANTGNNTFNGLTNTSGTVLVNNGGVNTVGPVAINGGSVRFANPGANTFSGIVMGGGTLTFEQTNTVTVGTVISGTGGQIVKEATNILVLSGANTFTGPIQVNTGTLRTGSGAALGTAAGTTTIASGAALDVNGQNLFTEPVVVSGSGVGGLGAIINAGAAQNNALWNVTLTGDTVFSAANRWDIRSTNYAGNPGVLSTGGNAYNLTKLGGSQFSLVNVNVDSELANVDITAGTLGYEASTTGLGNPTNTLTIRSNASVQFWAAVNPLNKVINIENGGILRAGSGTGNVVSGPVNLVDGMGRLEADASSSLNVTNEVGGLGGITRGGAGSVVLVASNSFVGNITNTASASGGALVLSNSFAAGTNKVIWGISTTGGSGLTGTRLTLAGGIKTPPDVWASFNSTNSSNIRSTMYSTAGTNEWTGTIDLRGPDGIVNFAADTPNYLILSGPVTNDAFVGTFFVRGTAGGGGELNGRLTIPNATVSKTDASVWMINTNGNTWTNIQIAVGTIKLGINDALCTTAPITMGQGDANAAAVDLNGFNQTIRSFNPIQGTGTRRIINTAATTSTFTFDGGTNSSNFGGQFQNAINLLVTSGSLAMNTVNTHTGDTTIAGGRFALGSAGTIATTPNIDVQAAGIFDVSALASGFLVAGNQTLKGNGVVEGSVSLAFGATLSPGASIGALTITNGMTMQAGSTNVMEVNTGAATNDVVNAAVITYGGTLQIANLGPALTAGNSFKLFNAGTYVGGFDSILPETPGAGLVWDTSGLLANGTLGVKLGIPTTPTNITFSVSGSTLTLTWPSDYLGWTAQSNSVDVSDANSWYDIPGSAAGTSLNITVEPGTPKVFYRLRYQTP